MTTAALIGTNSFGWSQWCEFNGLSLSNELDRVLGKVAESGIQAWEQGLASESEAEALAVLLKKHDLSVVSFYSGGRLHEEDASEAVARILESARWAKELGASRVVLNPDPINWGTTEDKPDSQLRRQASALIDLTQALAEFGMTLDYHTHAPEFRCGAREFHHMMQATEHVGMKWNLDAQWVHRGAGNSQVALEDALRMYGHRINSLHIRQTREGIWCHRLCDGDINYAPVVQTLRQHDLSVPLMIEIAFEEGTPRDADIVECHRQSVEWLRTTFEV